MSYLTPIDVRKVLVVIIMACENCSESRIIVLFNGVQSSNTAFRAALGPNGMTMVCHETSCSQQICLNEPNEVQLSLVCHCNHSCSPTLYMFNVIILSWRSNIIQNVAATTATATLKASQKSQEMRLNDLKAQFKELVELLAR